MWSFEAHLNRSISNRLYQTKTWINVVLVQYLTLFKTKPHFNIIPTKKSWTGLGLGAKKRLSNNIKGIPFSKCEHMWLQRVNKVGNVLIILISSLDSNMKMIKYFQLEGGPCPYVWQNVAYFIWSCWFGLSRPKMW